MKSLQGFSLILLGSFCGILAQDGPVIETDLGKIMGSSMKSAKGREFSAFRGIRYAQPPVGELRFKAPVAVESWGDSVYDATADGWICPQALFPEDLISEDCLFLNVYTGDLKGNATVLVYIHGGGNLFGSSRSDSEVGPQFLMDHNIVLVAMNYRLGALGFLTTSTKEAPGNYGYLDQLMALQWVNDRISKFGGNPNSVTIFGLSAGAMAVTLHMASPLSKGLFHRAIAMSGSTTNHFQFDNSEMTRKLARHLACPLYDPVLVVRCLRNVPWKKIVEVFSTWEPYGAPEPLWFYEVDGHFLLDKPTNTFASGSFNKVPVLAGITKDEFSYIYNVLFNQLRDDIFDNWDKYAPEFLTFALEPEASAKEKSDRIRNFYTTHDTGLSLGDAFADAIMGHGVYRLVELARKHVDVYYYRNDYLGSHHMLNLDQDIYEGVVHGSDIQYVFNSSQFDGRINFGDPDWFMVERMTEWWTSFARDGSPSDVDELKWWPTNSSSVFVMYNDKNLSTGVGRPFYYDRYCEWDAMFPVRSSADQVRVAWMLTAGAVALHVCAKSLL